MLSYEKIHLGQISTSTSDLFKSLKYDLGRNLIVSGEENPSLQRQSMIKIIGKCFKNKVIIDKILEQSLRGKSLAKAQKKWNDIEIAVFEMIVTSIPIPTCFYQEFRQIIHFFGNEILEFLLKLPDDKMNIFFLRNFVFTCQITINSTETVLKILDDKNVCNDCKLEIALQCFVGKRQIKECLKVLPCNDITELIGNKDINVALKISTYFWNWLINDNENSFKVLQKLMDLDAEQNVNKGFLSSAYNDNDNGIHSSSDETDSLDSESSDTDNDDKNDWLEELEEFVIAREKAEARRRGRENIDDSEIQRIFNEDENLTLFRVFNWMLDNNNEMAVQYLWNNVSYIRENITKLDFGRILYKNINIAMFIFSKCTFPSFDMIVISYFLVHCLIENLRWNTQFLRYFELFQPFCKNSEVLLLLCDIVLKIVVDLDKGRSAHLNKHILNMFLSKVFIKRKKYILFSQRGKFYNILFEVFSRFDTESCKILLYGIGIENENINNLLLSNDGVKLFSSAFSLCHFDFIDSIAKELKSHEKILELKIKIFNRMIYRTIASLIRDRKYKLKIEFIFKWSSELSLIDKVKKTIPYKENRFIIRELLFKNTEQNRFEQLDKFLHWCFSNDQEKMCKFKKEILCMRETKKRKNFYLDIREWVEHLQWDLLQKLFTWSNCSNQELLQLKFKLFNDDIFIHYIFAKEGGGLTFLFEFSYFCHTSASDKKEVALKILNQDLYFLKLIRNNDFEIIDDIILWCNPEESVLHSLKQRLLISSIDYLAFEDSKFSEEYFDDFVRWFEPSLKTRKKIRNMSVSYFKKNRRIDNLIRAIEEFVPDYII